MLAGFATGICGMLEMAAENRPPLSFCGYWCQSEVRCLGLTGTSSVAPANARNGNGLLSQENASKRQPNGRTGHFEFLFGRNNGN